LKAVKKILVIRFSSMGDIIYTTPVVRCLKLQIPNAEIHFLTKEQFKYIYNNNPYLDKLHLLKSTLNETIEDIKAEKFDLIIDLHNNLRTSIIKLRTGIKSSTYKKERIKKFLALKFKRKEFINPKHLVDRYLGTVEFLGVKNDGKPIDYYIKGTYKLADLLPETHQNNYVAFIIGATHFTKRLPVDKIITICKKINKPIVLLGGNDVEANATEIKNAVGNKIFNTCGKINLDQSVFLVANANSVIGFDTGLTHISEAFNKPLVSIWGGTTPELLGVSPYQIDKSLISDVDLACRPCSKFGLEECPLGHFKCMHEIDEKPIIAFTNTN
jgi:heptosyltransferase-2